MPTKSSGFWPNIRSDRPAWNEAIELLDRVASLQQAVALAVSIPAEAVEWFASIADRMADLHAAALPKATYPTEPHLRSDHPPEP